MAGECRLIEFFVAFVIGDGGGAVLAVNGFGGFECVGQQQFLALCNISVLGGAPVVTLSQIGIGFYTHAVLINVAEQA